MATEIMVPLPKSAAYFLQSLAQREELSGLFELSYRLETNLRDWVVTAPAERQTERDTGWLREYDTRESR